MPGFFGEIFEKIKNATAEDNSIWYVLQDIFIGIAKLVSVICITVIVILIAEGFESGNYIAPTLSIILILTAAGLALASKNKSVRCVAKFILPSPIQVTKELFQEGILWAGIVIAICVVLFACFMLIGG